MSQERLVLFIDAQNFYNGARRAFFTSEDSHVFGQFQPVGIGSLICSRGLPGTARSLEEVRVYTGRPDASKEPETYAAHMKQCAAWSKTGATVIARPLRYPPNWPQNKAQQKGVDVALAIDFVAYSIEGKYDVGVIASTDTDLIPALEFIRRFAAHRRVEVAAWTSLKSRSRLSIPRASIWCHWLDRTDYDSVADLTDYNI
jgi:uncharacterized LabA/DUF88 family protein